MLSFTLALALAAALSADGASTPGERAIGAQDPGATRPAAQAAPEKESPAALIRRSLAAYGGSRAQVRLGRVRVTGEVTSPLHAGLVGRYRRVFSRSNRLRLEVEFAGSKPEVRVLDGARAFRYGEPAPVSVAALLQLQAARLDLPALLVEWESRVIDAGEVTHEGQQLRVLGLEIAAGMRIEVGIDPRTARILYVRGLAENGPKEMELFTVFHDFRTVDGVLVAFQEEGWANGEPTGEVKLSKVEYLDDVPEASFEP